MNDIRYSVRGLGRTPGFTIVIVLTLALAIGANSAIFSVIQGVLLRPLPYAQPDRIVRIFFNSDTFPKFPLNPFDLRDFRARNRTFDSVAGIVRADVQLSASGSRSCSTCSASPAGYFRVLGFTPARGREFTGGDEVPEQGRVAILSDRVWRTRFASDPGMVGRTISLNAQTIHGGGRDAARRATSRQRLPRAGGWGHGGSLAAVLVRRGSEPARLAFHGGNRAPEARRFARAGAMRTSARFCRRWRASIRRSRAGGCSWFRCTAKWSGRTQLMLLVLLGAVGLLLLIACVNAANLLLARSSARVREIAVRSALGAARGRIVRQLVTESLVIALAAGALGTVLAVGGVRVLVAGLPAGFPRAARDSAGLGGVCA